MQNFCAFILISAAPNLLQEIFHFLSDPLMDLEESVRMGQV